MSTPSIFICYAHKDKIWLDRLLEHLAPLQLQEQAKVWSDQELELGDDWHPEIQTTLQQVKAAVLLVSSAFLASKYIRNQELPILLKRAQEDGVTILPIVVNPCMFADTKFKYPDSRGEPKTFTLQSLQAANTPNRPLNKLPEGEQDDIFLAVAKRLSNLVQPDP